MDVALADPLNLTGIVIHGPRSGAQMQGSIVIGRDMAGSTLSVEAPM